MANGRARTLQPRRGDCSPLSERGVAARGSRVAGECRIATGRTCRRGADGDSGRRRVRDRHGLLVDEIYHRDAWGLLAAAARETSRVRLAPGVAHVTLRDPLLVAQQLATLDELSDGRAAAAFSVGNLAMLEQFGYDPAELHPVRRLREAHRGDAIAARHRRGRARWRVLPLPRRVHRCAARRSAACRCCWPR